MAEFRLVNTAIDLSRSLLLFVKSTNDALLNVSINGLDTMESKLPDIPWVSAPGLVGAVPVAPVGLRLPPGRMRALAAPGAGAPQMAQAQPVGEGAVTVI